MPAKTTAKPKAEQNGSSSVSDNNEAVALLLNKPKATEEFTLYVSGEDGEQHEIQMKFTAIGMQEYDKLVAKYPPKADQRVEGATFDLNTFAPALISKCSVEPELSYAQAKQIWDSPAWSRGDLMVLFRKAVDLNNRGLDIPFSGID